MQRPLWRDDTSSPGLVSIQEAAHFFPEHTMRIVDLATLPLTERLAAMETLWDSLTHDLAHDPSPTWHATVLAQRRAQMENEHSIPWAEAKNRLRALMDSTEDGPTKAR